MQDAPGIQPVFAGRSRDNSISSTSSRGPGEIWDHLPQSALRLVAMTLYRSSAPGSWPDESCSPRRSRRCLHDPMEISQMPLQGREHRRRLRQILLVSHLLQGRGSLQRLYRPQITEFALEAVGCSRHRRPHRTQRWPFPNFCRILGDSCRKISHNSQNSSSSPPRRPTASSLPHNTFSEAFPFRIGWPIWDRDLCLFLPTPIDWHWFHKASTPAGRKIQLCVPSAEGSLSLPLDRQRTDWNRSRRNPSPAEGPWPFG